MTTEIQTAIEEAATDPTKRVRVGNQEVERHSIKEQIEADKYLGAKTAAASDYRGLVFNKISPPGAS